jgi:hypothetical protein
VSGATGRRAYVLPVELDPRVCPFVSSLHWQADHELDFVTLFA